MVCQKCSKASKGTSLATPAVKKKSEMYHGSSATGPKKSATTGQTGVVKSKLLSNKKNPYSSVCRNCPATIAQGNTLCNKHAFSLDLCHICGKSNKGGKAPLVSGQKRTMK